MEPNLGDCQMLPVERVNEVLGWVGWEADEMDLKIFSNIVSPEFFVEVGASVGKIGNSVGGKLVDWFSGK